jgi:hypothetical protein
MIAEQIGRLNIPSSHCRYIQKAASELLLPAAQYSGCQYLLNIKPRLASIPPPPSESTTAHAATATAAAAPLFPDKNKIACEYLLFLILIPFLHTRHYISSLGVKTLIKILRNRGALFYCKRLRPNN